MPTLSVHQPHFFPWPSYFLKIKKSDVFVILDDVQFRKNYFQNRCEISNVEGNDRRWLTLSIKKNISSKSKINEVALSEKFRADEILSTIRSSYSKTPFYEQVYSDIKQLFYSDDEHLCDINVRGILWCLKILDIPTTTLLSSQIKGPAEQNPTMRLVDLCIQNGMSEYISGPGGRNYMELPLFYDNNIDLLWHDSDKVSFEYAQPSGPFLPNLSILDMFFNIGYKDSAVLLNAEFI